MPPQMAEADGLIARGAYADAAAVLGELLFPLTEDRLRRAWCYSAAHDWDATIATAHEANAHEETAQGHYLIAHALRRGRRYPDGVTVTAEAIAKAKEHLERAVELPDAESHVFHALAELIDGHDDVALQRRLSLALRAIELDPSAVEPRLLAAEHAHQRREPLQVLEVLQPLVKLDPPPARACWLAAMAHVDVNEFRDAVRVAKRLRTAEPNDARALDAQLAVWLEVAGDTDVAVERLCRVATSDSVELRYVGLSQRARVRDAWARRAKGDLARSLRRLVLRDLLAAADLLLSREGSPGEIGSAIIHAADGNFWQVSLPSIFYTAIGVLTSEDSTPIGAFERAQLAAMALREASDEFRSLDANERDQLTRLAEPLAEQPGVASVLAWTWYEGGEFLRALRHFTTVALTRCRTEGGAFGGRVPGTALFQEIGTALSKPDVVSEAWSEVHAIGELLLGAWGSGADPVIVEYYVRIWRRVLIDAERYAELCAVADALRGAGAEEDPKFDGAFDAAFARHRMRDDADAERRYRELLTTREHATALHNLSLICRHRGVLDEALAFARRALAADPTLDYVAPNVAAIEEAIRVATAPERTGGGRSRAGRERRGRSAERGRGTRSSDRGSTTRTPAATPKADDTDFLRTAPDRWPTLDRYKRQLLATLTVITSFRGWEELERLSGVEARYLPGHWRKLVDAGMLLEDGQSWSINPHVRSLVERERQHAVATRFIRADESVAFKPVFNSRQEYTVYSILLGLFPNHLVFPNMGLQAVFQYERMKELLSYEEFGYYLRAQVDFCIVSTATYFPIIAFEVDSPYHDTADQQARDERKDEIFQRGGVPLLRLRPYGRPTADGMRGDIIAAVQSALVAMQQMDERARDRLAELDVVAFGVGAAS